ncbi:MAG TPA: hypothetical protein VGX78_16495 [Pirellulales bacterium]|nr:hypothetical protein [Pirellulales bacterium]
MNRFTVVWLQGAQDDLAELWINARDRSAVSAATRLIDIELSRDAPTKGVELHEGLHAFFAPPLRVLFTVDEADCVVEVVRVRLL